MSKLTEVLKLLCYDPETDGNLTFNVTEALTKNWEKIDQLVLLAVAVAAAYDPEGSYAVGDYCTHGGKLHKCSTEIPDGEAWTAEHWTETTVAVELAEVRASLSNKVAQLGKLSPELFDNPTHPNGYFASVDDRELPMPNIPAAGHWRLLYLPYFAATEGWAAQIAVGAVENSGLCWRKARGPEWQAWEFAATTTPPDVHNLTLASGVEDIVGFQSVYFKSQESIVTVILQCEGMLSDNSLVATLPVDCYPSRNMLIPCIDSSSNNRLSGFLRVNVDGTIQASYGGSERLADVLAAFSFDAAEVQ